MTDDQISELWHIACSESDTFPERTRKFANLCERRTLERAAEMCTEQADAWNDSRETLYEDAARVCASNLSAAAKEIKP